METFYDINRLLGDTKHLHPRHQTSNKDHTMVQNDSNKNLNFAQPKF